MFGSMCRPMIRTSLAPLAFAASTYSFSRSERNTPRTMRAIDVQKSSARMTPTLSGSPEPKKAEAVSSTASPGRVRIRSVNRISRLSILPPK